jgi:hypothetical protein
MESDDTKNEKNYNLYLVTCGLGQLYVISTDYTTAQEKVEYELEKSNYGFSKDRKVTNIKLLAEEIKYNYKSDKLNFNLGIYNKNVDQFMFIKQLN